MKKDLNYYNRSEEYRPTWRERIGNRYFPVRPTEIPKTNPDWKGTIVTRLVVVLDWKDRIRLLLSGKLSVHTVTVMERKPGESVSKSVSWVQPPEMLERKV